MTEKPDELLELPVVVEDLPEVVNEDIIPPDPMANFSQFQADVMQALDELRNAVAALQDDEDEAEPEENVPDVVVEETIIEPVRIETPEVPKPVAHRGRIY